MAKGIIVVAEVKDGAVRKVTQEMLGAARRIAGKTGEEVGVLLVGDNVAGLAGGLGQHGADHVYVVQDGRLAQYSSDGYTNVVAAFLRKHEPSLVLFANTVAGKDLAARVAARLGTGLASDCIGLEAQASGNTVTFTRPMYAGKIIAQVQIPDARPQLATVRPNTQDPQPVEPVGISGEAGAGRSVPVTEAQFDVGEIRTTIKETMASGKGRVELTEAEIVVSGGRGLRGPENWPMLEELAGVLGASLGASRAVVDAGWRPHAEQVGQTGKVVSPKLYFAVGISGAVQHLAGMSTSRCIVAINKDPNANIFKLANYGIVGDVMQVLPALTEEFRKALSEAPAQAMVQG